MRITIDIPRLETVADAIARRARPANSSDARAAAANAIRVRFDVPDNGAKQPVEFDLADAKSLASAIRAKVFGGRIAYGQILDGISEGLGWRDWNTLSAELARQPVFTLYPTWISWVWSGAPDPNGFAESAWLTPEAARALERMLDAFARLSGEISNVRVETQAGQSRPAAGVDAALATLSSTLLDNDMIDKTAYQGVLDAVTGDLGAPDTGDADRRDTLIAFQMNPQRVGACEGPHFMPQDIVRLTRPEQAFVQAVMNRLARLPELDGELWDRCVAEQPARDKTPIQASHDGLLGAIGLCCGYFADNCDADGAAHALREAFGDLVDEASACDLERKTA